MVTRLRDADQWKPDYRVVTNETPRNIGVGRFGILGEGGGRGGKVQNIGRPRWAKFFAGCKLIGAPAPNQCQIITFLTLKTDNIANLRIELKSIL